MKHAFQEEEMPDLQRIQIGQRLREARVRLNLSQEALAEKVGVSVRSIRRWEQGEILPHPYSRERLCRIFQSDTHTLFELGSADSSELETVSPAEEGPGDQLLFGAVPLPGLSDPALPLSPREASDLIGRHTLLPQLIEALCQGREHICALTGLPGVGKTALAVALAHHPYIKQQFSDGILWVGLGRHPALQESMHRWGTLLEVPAAEIAHLTTVDAWAHRLYQQIGQRRMLLILDDAWKLTDALTFRLGGYNCGHLLTTRIPAIAHAFARDQVFPVLELTAEEGLLLLEQLVPQARQQISSAQLQALVRAVGGLPLALVLMGGYLYVQAQSGQPRRLQRAWEQLQHNVQIRFSLNRPHAPGEPPADLPIGANLSLQLAIDMSTHQLPKQAQMALQSLALFPPKPYSFSEEAAQAICETSLEILDLLADSGLLSTPQPGRYYLHQTIADYARLSCSQPEAEERLVTFFVAFVCEHSKEYELLKQELHNIYTAFELARHRQMFAALLEGTQAFMPFVRTSRLFDLADNLLAWAHEAASALTDQQSLVHIWCWRGQMAELRSDVPQAEQAYLTGLAIAQKEAYVQMTAQLLILAGGIIADRGDFDQAETCLQEGLALATRLGEQEYYSIALKNLGEIADNRGEISKAQELYQESLVIARAQKNWKLASALLQNLGSRASHQGDYNEAESYYRQGLIYARQANDLQRECALLTNQGMIAYYRQDYQGALALSLQGLSLARKVRNNFRISSVLQNLGLIEGLLGHEAEAEAYFQESLELARAMGYRWLTCETNGAWGELYVRQHKLDAAAEIFQQMMEEATEIGAPLLQAQALFGLAQVADQRGQLQLALQYAQESYTLFQQLTDQRTKTVEQWLAMRLPSLHTPSYTKSE